ncbi:MAG: hypothetical protein ACREMX_00630 [Gemmatimonadales bacterium]
MSTLTVILAIAGAMLGVGLLAVLVWLLYTSYLNRVEHRLAKRKGLYRELVASLATRERALLEPEIRRMGTLLDLEALEAVLENFGFRQLTLYWRLRDYGTRGGERPAGRSSPEWASARE